MWDRLKDFFRPGFAGTVRQEEWTFSLAPDGIGGAQPLRVAIHPRKTRHVVVMLPGWDGAIDGYADKYVKMAALLCARRVGAVVRAGNHDVTGHAFEDVCRARLAGLLEGVVRNGPAICGTSNPDVFLFGFSAGASAMAALAARYPAVTKMLLVAPSSDAGYEAVVQGVRAYRGELYVIVGDQDEVVEDMPQAFFEMATETTNRALRIIPSCDHQFRGERNGRILSQAPLWAFLGDVPFPDPQRGIHLYD